MRQQMVQDGQCESCCFAGPGLRQPQQIPTIEQVRDGTALNRGRCRVTFLIEGLQKRLRKLQVRKGRHKTDAPPKALLTCQAVLKHVGKKPGYSLRKALPEVVLYLYMQPVISNWRISVPLFVESSRAIDVRR
jgi:hypothetical protein